MRRRRAIRTLLVFLLLGAVATVLSSWAIHAVQFLRWRASGMLPHITAIPIYWPVDTAIAEGMMIDTTIAPGGIGIDTSQGFYQFAPEEELNKNHGIATAMDVNADAAWRRYRSAEPRLGPLPGYPFPYRMFEPYPRKLGWRILGSETSLLNEVVEPPRGLVDERLFVLHAGWPLHAVSAGAHYAQVIENHPPTPPGRSPPPLFARVEQLAAPPAVSLRGGIELWHEPYPRIATGTARPIPYRPLHRFALPLLPLWPGFLINTLFYALLLFGAWRLPGVLRRALRRRRGRCVRCGYEREGLDPHAACPECGAHAIAGRSRHRVQ
ncbi:MAG: hypothetical protein RIE32_12720 [Phycisphaerales bacterium]